MVCLGYWRIFRLIHWHTSNYSGFESQDIDELYSTADSSGVEVIQLNSGNKLVFGDLVLTVIGPLVYLILPTTDPW